MKKKSYAERVLYNWAVDRTNQEEHKGIRLDEDLAGALYAFLLHYRPEFTAKTLAQRTESVIEMLEMLKTQQV